MVAISVIIPCYNEAKRVVPAVREANLHLTMHRSDEVIFVDDGSKDGTAQVISREMTHPDRMRVIGLGRNRGKWGAICEGVLAARNPYVVFLDADLSVGFEFVDACRPAELKGVLSIGNRYASGETEVPFKRLVFSKVFNMLVKKMVGLKVRDTQCPAKGFDRSDVVLGVMAGMKEEGYVGDVEFLVKMSAAGSSIVSLPVVYKYHTSNFSPVKQSFKMFAGLMRIRKESRENIARSVYTAEQKNI